MRRWTDGKSWSASRVAGSFLTYREMEGKRGGGFTPTPQPKRRSGKSPDGSGESDGEGPDGYRYKPDGLSKQSFSITLPGGQHLHLISYLSRSAPESANLQQPTTDPALRHIRPPKNMYPESSVNETTAPPVTRGPMPGSPYAPVPQQMSSPSPFPRPGPSSQSYMPPQWSTTPPVPQSYPHLVWDPTINCYVAYAPSQIYHPQPLENLPPHLRNVHGPPYQAFRPPYPGQMPYAASQPPRAMQPAELVQHPLAVQQPNVRQTLRAPEQGPVLPAINSMARPQETNPNESQEANGNTANNAPSPNGRRLNINSMLNNHATSGAESASRSGSRSPTNPQRPPREMLVTANSRAADVHALHKLNTVSLR
jgi:hypothetical protein